MQCTSCGKTGFVIIGNKRYCSSCGSKLDDQGAPRMISDLRPSSGSTPTVVPTQPVSLAPGEQVNPAPEKTAIPAPTPNPAGQLHGVQIGNQKPAILDLRQKPTQPPASIPVPSAPSEPPVTSVEAPPAASVDPPAPIAEPPVSAPVAAPTTAAAAPPAPTQIAKPIPKATPFGSLSSPSTSQDSGTQPAASVPAQPTPIIDTHPKVKRFPDHPEVAGTTEEPATAQSGMPNQVATQIDAMKNMVTPDSTAPKPTALKEILETAKPAGNPRLTQIAAAIAAIGIMAGLVWAQNSPKMAFRSASNQAGIEASMPTYIPSSYRQDGPAKVSPGQITLSFVSPSSQEPLTIIQKRTSWDSNSLRENFVSRQSDNLLAVQGQGLTIFLFNDQASWVNHGVWYTVDGAEHLSRDQILRLAYGL